MSEDPITEDLIAAMEWMIKTARIGTVNRGHGDYGECVEVGRDSFQRVKDLLERRRVRP